MNNFNHYFFILIPARNEAESLSDLLSQIKTSVTSNIVVVDNNSSDNTFEIAKSFTKHVIKEKNMGYGNACLAGIKYINKIRPPPEFVCFFDGDGQSQVSDINKILSPFSSSNIRYCQGSRMVKQSSFINLTGSAYVANKVFAKVLSFIWKQHVTDLGPLRCINLTLLNRLNMTSTSYAWTIEMNVKLMKSQIPIIELPVEYKSRKFGRSKISGNIKNSLQAAILMTLSFLKTAIFWRVTVIE